MAYAIISVGGKQYRVSEGQRLLVDRLPTEEGKTFNPTVLLVGGDGGPQLAPKDTTVTVKVIGRLRGPKIRIGKYRQRTGYRRHTGFRAALTQIEIESIGARKARTAAKPKAEAAPPAEEKPASAPTAAKTEAAAPRPTRTRAAKPKAEGGAPTAKPAATKPAEPAEKPAATKKPATTTKPAARRAAARKKEDES